MNYSSVSVNVSPDTIWEVLIDRIYHPSSYDKTILESHIIVTKRGTELLRRMKTALGEIIERIIIDLKNSEIVINLVQHPVFTGSFVQRITPLGASKRQALLTFISNKKPKKGALLTHPDNSKELEEEVLHTKAIAEELE
jgi:hypothetical protein